MKTKIEKAADEWSIDYKPSSESLAPSEYARYGFIKGANRIIAHVIKTADKLDDLRFEYEQRYLKHGKQIDLDTANDCTARLRCLNEIIEFHTVTE